MFKKEKVVFLDCRRGSRGLTSLGSTEEGTRQIMVIGGKKNSNEGDLAGVEIVTLGKGGDGNRPAAAGACRVMREMPEKRRGFTGWLDEADTISITLGIGMNLGATKENFSGRQSLPNDH